MTRIKNPRTRATRRRTARKAIASEATGTVGLRIAAAIGLLAGPKTGPVNGKASPRLFQAAEKRAGTTSPTAVINAALAALATEVELGPWLALNWGVLAEVPPELLDQIDL